MNTATSNEVNAVRAVGDVSLIAGAPGTLLLVALNKLRPSARNVRSKGRLSVTALARSILRVGLLQNLAVTRVADSDEYLVVAGRRRLAALKLLAKRGKLPKDYWVSCLEVSEATARTVSLTENVQREDMHPADQFKAFASLAAEGRPIEDIAADFGVTPLVVQRRLKLANVSPRLLAKYRVDGITLDQLMALAVTDDHAAQEAAFYDAPSWQRDPESLRDQLTKDEIDARSDALAKFVGVPAYEAVGGGVRRDLFADDHCGSFLTDPALLESLARDKLAPTADEVRGEGWGWVEVAPRTMLGDLHQFQRLRSQRHEPTKSEAKRIAKLEAQQSELQSRFNDVSDEMTDDEAQARQSEIDRLGTELHALDQALVVYPAQAMVAAGAVVSLDRDGRVVVHRGLLRTEQARALRDRERSEAGETDGSGSVEGVDNRPHGRRSGLCEKLVRRLSAHRTAALQAEVARHPHVALVALVHRLALKVIFDNYHDTLVDITPQAHDRLEHHAVELADSPAATGMRRVREAWAERLPEEPEALFRELLAMEVDELLSLLAVCVASTIDAVTPNEDAAPAATLARAVELDMHVWWKPTAAGYFDHVTKIKALEAVQAVAPDHVMRVGKLKKADIASEAERLVAGSDWLPSMLRPSDPGEQVMPTPLSARPVGALDSGIGRAQDKHDQR